MLSQMFKTIFHNIFENVVKTKKYTTFLECCTCSIQQHFLNVVIYTFNDAF